MSSDNFGILIKRERVKRNVSQEQMANSLGINRRTLIRVEQGESYSEEMKSKLLSFFSENHNKILDSIFDYVRFQIPTHDLDRILNQVLRIDKAFMEHKEFGLYGYTGGYFLDMVQIFYSPDDSNKGCLIQLSGQGCRQFEGILKAQRRTWNDFFRECLSLGGHPTRIDLAINDYKRLLYIPTLKRKIKRMEYKTTFRTTNYEGGNNLLNGERKGMTLYIGSKKSDFYLCLYEKDYEQSAKLKIDRELIDIKNRYEIRVKDAKAKNLLTMILNDSDIHRIALGVINHHLEFTNAKGQTDRKWANFIGEVEKLKLSVAPTEKFYEKSKRWFARSCAATGKMIRRIDSINHTSVYADTLINAELTPTHEHMIKVNTTPVSDMIRKAN